MNLEEKLGLRKIIQDIPDRMHNTRRKMTSLLFKNFIVAETRRLMSGSKPLTLPQYKQQLDYFEKAWMTYFKTTEVYKNMLKRLSKRKIEEYAKHSTEFKLL